MGESQRSAIEGIIVSAAHDAIDRGLSRLVSRAVALVTSDALRDAVGEALPFGRGKMLQLGVKRSGKRGRLELVVASGPLSVAIAEVDDLGVGKGT